MTKGYNPYAKGRWYRFFIESNGEAITLVESDIEDAVVSGTRIKMPVGFHCMEEIYDISAVPGGTAAGMQHSTYIYADGCQAVNIPAKDLFDWAYVYVFGYFD